MKKRILCFGDSNTWGYIAEGHKKNYVLRQPADTRWPGAASRLLGETYEVLEEGLNGRTTGFDDPSSDGRNGLAYLKEELKALLPVDTAVIALGVNDLKPDICGSITKSRQAMAQMLDLLKETGISDIILILPAYLTSAISGPPFCEDFCGPDIISLSEELNVAYRDLALAYDLPYIDAAQIAEAGRDGLHLTGESHRKLGEAVAHLILSRQEKSAQ